MKKLMITAMFVTALCGLTMAQKNPGKKDFTPAQRAEAVTAKMDEKLHFSASQRPKVYALNLKQANDRELVRTGKADKAAIKSSHKENRKKLLALLNDDQKKNLKQLKTKHARAGKEAKGKPGRQKNQAIQKV